ncbi:cytochrome P450 [Mycena pura]|uniref:Cytochrome P450 n=1 Tax=Mycena pura TaxID=153505 RepID=A0AAD6VFG6_9AGAR|nr:cytochrome P450 [Mycena pura]
MRTFASGLRAVADIFLRFSNGSVNDLSLMPYKQCERVLDKVEDGGVTGLAFSDAWLGYIFQQGYRSEVVHKMHLSERIINHSQHSQIGTYALYGHGNGVLKSTFYDAFVSFQRGLFNTRDCKQHVRKRKIDIFFHKTWDRLYDNDLNDLPGDEGQGGWDYLAFDIIGDLACAGPSDTPMPNGTSSTGGAQRPRRVLYVLRAWVRPRLPFLDVCINGALRLHSTSALGLPRIVPEGALGDHGLSIDGNAFPPGTVLSVPSFTIHRDPNVWGPDVEVACVGRNLATLELQIIVASILRRFHFVLEKPKDGLPTREDFLRKPLYCHVGIRRRDVM